MNNPNWIDLIEQSESNWSLWLWLTTIDEYFSHWRLSIYDLWSQWKGQNARLWSKLCIAKKTPYHRKHGPFWQRIAKCCIKSYHEVLFKHQVISHHSFDSSQCQLCVVREHPDVWSIATKVGSSKGRKDQVQKCLNSSFFWDIFFV